MAHCRTNTGEGRTDCFLSLYQISVHPRRSMYLRDTPLFQATPQSLLLPLSHLVLFWEREIKLLAGLTLQVDEYQRT